MTSEALRVDAARLSCFIAQAFEVVGMPPDDARTVAGLMTQADLQGSDGHGVRWAAAGRHGAVGAGRHARAGSPP